MQTVLTIAGFDPSSGAGVTADLMVFAAHGLFGTSAITSLTVQSTIGVYSVRPVEAEIVRETLDCLHDDMPPAGVKIGMLATSPIVEAVCSYLRRLRHLSPGVPIVLDPVIQSSSGRELLDGDGLACLQGELLPLATWVTPNLSELSILSGLSINSSDDLEPACRVLQKTTPGLAVLAKGGHLETPNDLVLTLEGDPHWLSGELVRSRSTHGTGCALSSALLSGLVRGLDPLEAATAAKRYVAEAIRRAQPLGYGHGPLNHLWPLR